MIDSETAAQELYHALQEIADRTDAPEAKALAALAEAAVEDRNLVPEDDLSGRELAYMTAYRDAVDRQLPMRAYMAVEIAKSSWERVAFALNISASEAQERYVYL